MTQKSIGPTFGAELAAAGLAGLPMSWTADGDLHFGDGMTDAKITAAQAVYAAHDPNAVDLRAVAILALDASDKTIFRCYEAGVAVPAEWRTYRTELRAIVAGGSAAAVLPTAPAYPAGT